MNEPGHNKDGRALRTDNRTRHDGKVSPSLSGPVIKLDPTTMQPIEPKRINITAKDSKAALDLAGSLSFADQQKQIERANSILLSRIISKVDAQEGDIESLLIQLQKAATITKQFLVEERNTPQDIDPTKLTTQELMKAAK